MIAKTDTQHYSDIADSVRYSLDGTQYESSLAQARAEIAEDNELFEDISEAIQSKTRQVEPYEKDELASTISSELSTPLVEKDVNFFDYDGELLASYTRAEILSLSALPENTAAHELLTFQGWNWTLSDIQSYMTNRPYGKLDIGAIYTTTDGQNHNYWNNPRLSSFSLISSQKRGSTTVGAQSFYSCPSLAEINISEGTTELGISSFAACSNLRNIFFPKTMQTIGAGAFDTCTSLRRLTLPLSVTALNSEAFRRCSSLTQIEINDGVTALANRVFSDCQSLDRFCIYNTVTSIGTYAFSNCKSLVDVLILGTPTLTDVNAFESGNSNLRFYVPQSNLSWFETATNWAELYSKFVSIEDNIEYLESLGFDVHDYESYEATI